MLELVALIVPLGLDNFAVCAAIGVAGVEPARRLRLSLLFATFEVAMPVLGLAVGLALGDATEEVGELAAALLLIGFGANSLRRDETAEQERLGRLGDLRGAALLLFALAISVDELAVGLSLGLLGLPVLPALVLIGVQAFVFSQLGLRLGAIVGERVREWSERLAGLALLVIGIALLVAQAI